MRTPPRRGWLGLVVAQHDRAAAGAAGLGVAGIGRGLGLGAAEVLDRDEGDGGEADAGFVLEVGRALEEGDGARLEPERRRDRPLGEERLLEEGLLTLPLVLGRTTAPPLTVGRPDALPLFTLALDALTLPDILPLVV